MAKITTYDIFFVQPRWLFLKLETDDGLIEWGEPILEGRAKTVAQAVIELMGKYVLKYENIDNIEDI
jgi:galactonate dehydratase